MKNKVRLFLPSWLQSVLNSYSDVLFVSGCGLGFIILILTLIAPNMGLMGMISVATAYAFARFIGMGNAFLSTGFYTYNALLVGLSLGHLFQLSPLSIFFASVAGIMTLLATVMMNNVFKQFFQLPILSLPFVIVSSILYLASTQYTSLYVTTLYVPPVFWQWQPHFLLDGFFRALGAIFFMPQASVGLLLFAILCWHSRIQAFLAIAGFLLGATITGLLDGILITAYADPNNFNFILIAIALGGVFFVPAPKTFLVTAIAVICAAVLQDAVYLIWSVYNIPIFTLPFVLITLGFIYVLSLVKFPLIAHYIGKTPELTLDDHWNRQKRFPQAPRKILLPFSGNWTLWQGFNGDWTHQGSQQHACDFYILLNDKSYRNNGLLLTDYYAWGKPVFSPCKGRVVSIQTHVEDNPVGQVNRVENWGNYVLIDTGLGWHVMLSHFSQSSITVSAGDWVEAGVKLGLCGNSGYSPQPHIHIHTQTNDSLGDATLPFVFVRYLVNDEFNAYGIPQSGDVVQALQFDHGLAQSSAFVLDQTYQCQYQHEHYSEECHLKVSMNILGETYFETSLGCLYFNHDESSFYFYRIEGKDPALALIYACLPRTPLAYEQKMRWDDYLPLLSRYTGFKLHSLQFLRIFWPRCADIRYSAEWVNKQTIKGHIFQAQQPLPFQVKLSKQGLIQSIQCLQQQVIFQHEV